MLNPKGFNRQWFVLICGDACVAIGSAYGAAAALVWYGLGAPAPAAMPGISAALAVIAVFVSYMSDLYKLDQPYVRSRIARSVMSAQPLVGGIAAIVLFAEPSLVFGRRFFIGYMLISGPAMLTWRLAAAQLFVSRIRIGVAILGIGEGVAMIAKEVLHRVDLGYAFLGFVEFEPKVGGRSNGRAGPARTASEQPGHPGMLRVKTLARLDELSGLRILAIGDPRLAQTSSRDLIRLRLGGVEVLTVETLYERMTGRLPVGMLSESRLALEQGFCQSRTGAVVKRTIDLMFSVCLGLIVAPLAAAVAVAVKLDSPGPVLYSQERVGRDGRLFRVLKFRSMRRDAERVTGAVWASDHDPRITRVGHWLRKWRIDELPQLINIMRGEMTAVGPRPERPEIVARLAEQIPFYEYRHLVRPGLTGWAQVCYPYGATVTDAEQKLCYDLYYMKNWSLGFDIQIMFQTLKVVLFGRGAR